MDRPGITSPRTLPQLGAYAKRAYSKGPLQPSDGDHLVGVYESSLTSVYVRLHRPATFSEEVADSMWEAYWLLLLNQTTSLFCPRSSF